MIIKCCKLILSHRKRSNDDNDIISSFQSTFLITREIESAVFLFRKQNIREFTYSSDKKDVYIVR